MKGYTSIEDIYKELMLSGYGALEGEFEGVCYDNLGYFVDWNTITVQ